MADDSAPVFVGTDVPNTVTAAITATTNATDNRWRQAMESIQVTTATHSQASDACYVPINDSLLIAGFPAQVYRMYPAAPKRKSELLRLLTSSLVEESDALPIQSLVAIIFDFAITTGTIPTTAPPLHMRQTFY